MLLKAAAAVLAALATATVAFRNETSMSAKSLLFTGTLPFGIPPGCSPGRQEVTYTIQDFGRLYTVTMRDKTVVEDPYLVLVKAEAFAIATGEPFAGITPERAVRDFLIKSNVVI